MMSVFDYEKLTGSDPHDALHDVHTSCRQKIRSSLFLIIYPSDDDMI